MVSGLSNVKAIAAGGSDSFALLNDGTVMAWGNGKEGELGNGALVNSATLVPVSLPGAGQVTIGSLQASPQSLVFSGTDLGQVSSLSLTLTNNGDQAATVSGVSVSGTNGPDFTVGAGTCPSLAPTLPGHASCNLAVTFSPQAAGSRSATLTVQPADSGAAALILPLSGQGLLNLPAAPVMGAATATGPDSVLVFFTPLAGSGYIYTVTASPGGQSASGTSSPIVVSGLASGTAYTFTVTATNAVGVSTRSAVSNRAVVTGSSATTGGERITATVTGSNFTLALLNDGTVLAWGDNSSGQLGDGSTVSHLIPKAVPGLNNVQALAAGKLHALALLADGTVRAWGDNSAGQLGLGNNAPAKVLSPAQVPGLGQIQALSAGGGCSLALASDGTVWAWGFGSYGQLGDNTTNNHATPEQVAGLADVRAITVAGGLHALALLADGTVWAWGDNNVGQLGLGSISPALGLSPALVPGLDNVTAIAEGRSYSLALKGDGTVWAWGDNSAGQLGLGAGSPVSVLSPTQVPGLSKVRSIAAGWWNTVALSNDGSVWAWGSNVSGQLGNGGGGVMNQSPVAVPGLSNVVAISAGGNQTQALMGDGSLMAWGDNSAGQLGNGATGGGSPESVSLSSALRSQGASLAPAAVTATVIGPGAVSVSFVPALDAVGPGLAYTVSASPGGQQVTGTASPIVISGLDPGANYTFTVTAANSGTGENGVSAPSNSVTPATDASIYSGSGLSIAALAAGSDYTLALMSDGTVWAWGDNSAGQLGDGTTVSRFVPEPVPGLKNVVAIAAGRLHTVVLLADGTVWAWGNNAAGQLGLDAASHPASLVPVQVPGLSQVRAISAGGGTSVALMSDGTVEAWGFNGYGQLGDGGTITRSTPQPVPGLKGVTAITVAGGLNVTALLADGTVWAWGDNSAGQLGLGAGGPVRSLSPVQVPGLSNVAAIAEGRAQTVALLKDGTVWVWGNNSYGQLGLGAGSLGQVSSPVQVPGLSQVQAIAAGWWNTFALRADGSLMAWGDNLSGQLGVGSAAFISQSPAVVAGLSNITAIAAGPNHAVALRADGSLGAFGDNSKGQLGNGVSGATSTQAQVLLPGVPRVGVEPQTLQFPATIIGQSRKLLISINNNTDQPVTISGGEVSGANSSAFAVDPGGCIDATLAAHAICSVQLTFEPLEFKTGDSPLQASVSLVLQDASGGAATQLSVALSGQGIGLPGAPAISGVSLTPDINATVSFSAPSSDGGSPIVGYRVLVADGSGASLPPVEGSASPIVVGNLLAGHSYSFTVLALNANGPGALSSPVSLVAYDVTASGARERFVSIAAGWQQTLALLADGSVMPVGAGGATVAGPPAGLSGVAALAVGGAQILAPAPYAVALRTDGTVTAWGDNSLGQAAVPDGLSEVAAIAAGGAHVLALKADGTVVGWGSNSFGQATAPSGLSGVAAIAAGLGHSLALRADGTVVAWGRNNRGQATVPDNLSGVVSVAAGWGYSAALKRDGTVAAWGSYDGGTTSAQVSVPAGLRGVVAIAAGSGFTLALKNNGTVVGWGNNLPALPAGLSGVMAISAGDDYAVIWQRDGYVAIYPQQGAVSTWTPLAAGRMIGGAISCASPVKAGDDSACAVTPYLGYRLTSFRVDGLNRMSGITAGVYSLRNVQANQTVAATFAVSPTRPLAPLLVNGTPGNRQATISFAPPLSNGGSQIFYYTVTATSGGKKSIVSRGVRSPITVRGLTNGTPYTFVVTARNRMGQGVNSPSLTLTPAMASAQHEAPVSRGYVLAR
ncbi:MAG: fibronectin type III domain-containing protein [Desulfobacteraceae bacterium]|nr:fibronectin type III domain-containing protein [Desulfobacteraceae bacterium]